MLRKSSATSIRIKAIIDTARHKLANGPTTPEVIPGLRRERFVTLVEFHPNSRQGVRHVELTATPEHNIARAVVNQMGMV